MPSLERTLRKNLENAVKKARRVAEAGARKAIESLAVHHHEPWPNLTVEQRQLRNRLRAHGKQLGDVAGDKPGTRRIDRLVGECAYENWHRMLFARFLAENDLLIEPEHGVMTLEYCQDLARDKGVEWLELASSCAVRMLPEVFRPDDPVLEVTLPPETASALEDLLKKLPCDVFTASDSLGWCYQFWQAERKEEVNASGNKIGADELPAVTQLFTEDYMVDFLLDNTLGAWHAGKVLAANPTLAATAQSEEELRNAVALPGCPWKYLRFVEAVVAGTSSSGSQRKHPEQDAPATLAPATLVGPDWETLAIRQGDNLPHWTCEHAIYHVDFRLADALPLSIREQWVQEREDILKTAQQLGRPLSAAEEQRLQYLYSEKVEAYLDAGHGACWMKQANIAQIVADALTFFNGQRYHLHAWCVMPNHVHVIVEPFQGHKLDQIVHSWKSFTANEINKALRRTGQVWQHEPYDHIIRSEKEYAFQLDYVWSNPDKSGIDAPRWRLPNDPEAKVANVPGASCSGIKAAEASCSGAPDTPQEPEQDAPATKTWVPAAGAFEGWPKAAKELTCLDPCMGSGHFVVALFERLVALRIAEEGLDEKAAVTAVIRDNLFGLEIDPRCTQIGAFNLALAAWRRVDYCNLPPMNIACSGLAPNAREEDWLAMVDAASSRGSEDQQQDAAATMRLRNGMARLYRLFKDAPVLGSLINPRAGEGDLLVAAFHELQPLLEKALAQETKDDSAHDLSTEDPAKAEMAVTARGLAKAAEILGGQFTLVATNVPYLGRGNQDGVLQDYCDRVHPEAKNDLATCFAERCLDFCGGGGSTSLVTPQNWFSQPRYEKLRTRLLTSNRWHGVARLGSGAFETIGGEVVTVSLVMLSNNKVLGKWLFMALDLSDAPTVADKSLGLAQKNVMEVSQASQLKNPDAIITLDSSGGNRLLNELARAWQGLVTGDDNRFYGVFWERGQLDGMVWSPVQQAPQASLPFTGRETVARWENGKGDLHLGSKAHNFPPPSTLGKTGIAIQRMVSLNATLFSGDVFDDSVAPLIPEKPAHLQAMYAFCLSDEFKEAVRRINHQPKVIPGALAKVPFDLPRWQKVAAEKYPDGLPKPFSSDPTQWLFNGHPQGSDQPLQVAVARLLGYQWPRQTGSSFPDCPALGPDGLERFADDDGIVCLNSIQGEPPAGERVQTLLAAAFGAEWSAAKLATLLADAGYAGKTLDTWLREGFFEQHCNIFHQRPFIWHIWDGLRDGFNALVNYHNLTEGGRTILVRGEEPGAGCSGHNTHSGRRTLDKLVYTYLGDWITRQRDDQKHGVEGADARLAAALHLQEELKKILAGEPPYDLFVRWKPLHQQAIGWDPDINDGVRMNIRPFMTARPLNARAKNACILRVPPKIKWDKDRGKEPQRPKEDYPWFWSWDERAQDFPGGKTFDGVRWNDLHYTNAAKQAARDRRRKG